MLRRRLAAGNTTLGDPDFVNVVPSEQFLDRYVFFTDYTFPDTSLVVVRRTHGDGLPARHARVRRRAHRTFSRSARRANTSTRSSSSRRAPSRRSSASGDMRLRPARSAQRRAVLGHRLGNRRGRELRLRRRHGQPPGQRRAAADRALEERPSCDAQERVGAKTSRVRSDLPTRTSPSRWRRRSRACLRGGPTPCARGLGRRRTW